MRIESEDFAAENLFDNFQGQIGGAIHFGNALVGAGVEGLLDQIGRIKAGEDDDGDNFEIGHGPDLADQLGAVHAGQGEVHLDEVGVESGQHFQRGRPVIHRLHHETRINRAWGLAMRKRFCRSFDFELQASADDNGIVLSLGAQHSFPLEQMFRLVPSRLARDVLVQAFLAVPFFNTRWRWNVTRALQLKRFQKGHRVPPHLQRMRADDLLTAVFPAQTACQENVIGDIRTARSSAVRQTVDDCLFEAADIEGWLNVLRDIESGKIEMVALDSREPSPFAHELLNANPYAFLDDAPLEERRARAVATRRTLSIDALRNLGRLDPDAVTLVKEQAWPLVRDADELHDALLSLAALPADEGAPWQEYFAQLRSTGRATLLNCGDRTFWAATKRRPLAHAIWPDAVADPEVSIPPGVRQQWPREEAIAYLIARPP